LINSKDSTRLLQSSRILQVVRQRARHFHALRLLFSRRTTKILYSSIIKDQKRANRQKAINSPHQTAHPASKGGLLSFRESSQLYPWSLPAFRSGSTPL